MKEEMRRMRINEHVFHCAVCQGQDEPCELTVYIEEKRCNDPELCPFNCGPPDWLREETPQRHKTS